MRSALALVLLLLLTPAGQALAGPATAPADPFKVFGLVRFDSGIRVPEFTLPGLDGGQVSVSPRTGSADILVFWATW